MAAIDPKVRHLMGTFELEEDLLVLVRSNSNRLPIPTGHAMERWLRRVVAATPVAQVLLETDAPYLTPVPYRGKPNAPYYLPFVAEKIAAIKELAVENLLRQTYQNSLDLFFHDTPLFR